MELEEVCQGIERAGSSDPFVHFQAFGQGRENRGLPVESCKSSSPFPASTLSHHIAALVSVGLVKQNRESRTLLCVSIRSAGRDHRVFP